MRGENELWLAAALVQPSLMLLEPHQLAATIAALLCPETLNRGTVSCNYAASEQVQEAIRSIHPARQRIQALQVQCKSFGWFKWFKPLDFLAEPLEICRLSLGTHGLGYNLVKNG